MSIARVALNPVLGGQYPFATFYAAVAVAVWYGGALPATIAAVLGYLLAHWFVIEPRYAFDLFAPVHLAGTAVYAFASGAITLLGTKMRSARFAAEAHAAAAREGQRRLEREIEERNRVEAALRAATAEAERRARETEDAQRTLQSLFDHVPEGITMTGGPPDFPIIAHSRYGQQLLGQPEAATVGMAAGEHAESHGLLCVDGVTRPSPEQLPLYRATHRGEVVTNEEWIIERPDGRRLVVLINATPIRDAAGNILGAINCWRDITERRRLERVLDESEARFQRLAEAIPQMVWTATAEGAPEYSNRRWHEYTGLGGGENPHSWQQALHPDDLPGLLARWHEALRTGDAFERELRLRRASDGAFIWHLARAIAARDHQGRIIRWFGTLTEIEGQKRAQEVLREADRRKDKFLATLAHELRNPLAPLSNAIEAWPYVETDPERVHQLRGIMERQVRQLVRLIDELLDVSRITRGRVQLHPQPVALRTLLEGAFETVQPMLLARHHEATLSLPPDPITLDGDVGRLVQVFANLLHNAAKYTEPHGRIEVIAERKADWAVVRVRDNGPGIPAAMLDSVFDMFTQADTTLSRADGGLGIGLTLVKSLVELHGGTVAAYSAGLGRGSEFVVRLPVRRAETATTQTAATSGDPAALPTRRVLIIDDTEASVSTLSIMFEALGQRVRTAADGVTGIAAAREFRPDIAFVDIAMPGMDGYEVAQALRSYPELERLRLVALTGFCQEEDRRRALAAGFHDHVVKPANLEVLRRLLLALPTPARR